MHNCSLVAQGASCIIGMVSLPPLPGSYGYQGASFEQIAEHALADAKTLHEWAVDGIFIQNTGSLPAPVEGSYETVAYMAALGTLIRHEVSTPIGVNVLKNGTESTLAIAHAIGSLFVRIKVYVGAVVGAEGIEEGTALQALEYRRKIGGEQIAIVADVHDRTSTPMSAMPITLAADLAWRHGRADGLVITGQSVPDTLRLLREVREAVPQAPLWVGGGSTVDNVADFLAAADGVIVGSSIKTGPSILDPIDPEKLARYMDAARGVPAV